MMREPVVRVANTDISGCDCGIVWGDVPRASAKPCCQGRQRCAEARSSGSGGQAFGSQAGCVRAGSSRCCCGWSGAHADRPVRHLGRLHGDAERQEGLAKPSSSKTNPPNRPRDPAYAFVSTRPAERVVNEVSIMIGYALKPGSESSLEVGGSAYAMYTQGDGLWIKNAAEEEQMVAAMRKSADATVKGVSAKGTETVDVFSLKGLSQALDRLAQDCRR
jgi:Invasion associated locus B (IalB) protein